VQISRGKPRSLPRTPAGFTALALDGYGLCDFLPARPTKSASYPVAVRRVAISFHASFRRSLAVPPLRFARASPPSGCTGDFHPQTAGHAQHTGRCAPAGAGGLRPILDRGSTQRRGYCRPEPENGASAQPENGEGRRNLKKSRSRGIDTRRPVTEEHFPSLLNRAGFPRRGRSDSSCALAEEAGMHGESAVG
jgi:hypothetical protein